MRRGLIGSAGCEGRGAIRATGQHPSLARVRERFRCVAARFRRRAPWPLKAERALRSLLLSYLTLAAQSS